MKHNDIINWEKVIPELLSAMVEILQHTYQNYKNDSKSSDLKFVHSIFVSKKTILVYKSLKFLETKECTHFKNAVYKRIISLKKYI